MRSKIEKQFSEALQKNISSEFSCNDRLLPGTPDIVFNSKYLAIFFHGCYWQSHHCQKRKHSFQWHGILEDIKVHDTVCNSRLLALGYETLIVWECEWRSNPNAVLEEIKGRLHFALPLPSTRKIYLQAHQN